MAESLYYSAQRGSWRLPSKFDRSLAARCCSTSLYRQTESFSMRALYQILGEGVSVFRLAWTVPESSMIVTVLTAQESQLLIMFSGRLISSKSGSPIFSVALFR